MLAEYIQYKYVSLKIYSAQPRALRAHRNPPTYIHPPSIGMLLMLSQSGKTGLMDSGQIPRPAMDDSAKPHGYPGRNRGSPTNKPQRVIVFTTSNSKNWTDDTKFNGKKVKNKITQMLCTQASGDRDWALTGNQRVRSPRRSQPCTSCPCPH